MNVCVICSKECNGSTCSGSCRAKLSRQSARSEAHATQAHGQAHAQPEHYATRTNPDTLNTGELMTAHQLKQAGLKANRVPIPGDHDYKGVCVKQGDEWQVGVA